jgi:hypothetical protein
MMFAALHESPVGTSRRRPFFRFRTIASLRRERGDAIDPEPSLAGIPVAMQYLPRLHAMSV